MKKLLIIAMLASSLMGADAIDVYVTKLIKTTKGFNAKRVKTYYTSRIVWGDGYCDHNETTAFKNGVVIAYGDGWSYSAITDPTGKFKVEVKGNKEFTIKASDGSFWNVYNGTLPAIPTGTTKTN